MKLQCSVETLGEIVVDSLVLFVPALTKISDKNLRSLDVVTDGAVTTLLESEEFTGKNEEIAVILNPPEYEATRVILVGVGEKTKLNADSFRRAAGVVSRSKALQKSTSAAFVLLGTERDDYHQATIEGYLLGSFKQLEFKTGEAAECKNKLESITFVLAGRKSLKKIEKAVERGNVVAEGQLLVRRLVNTPSNFLTPTMLADQAKDLARKYKFKYRALDEAAIKKEKMGALLSVSKGSQEPPRFIVLEYNGGRTGGKPVVLVGKGVCFDSGGISLKPGLNMHEMKGDMAGSAVVLAAIVTAARLKLPINLVSLMPAVENLPSGVATKPGDVVTSRKGLTVEVINTDAEGRMILADALDYANKFKPQAVIDIATLTGASLYVLGYSGAPIMGNNEPLLKRIMAASEKTAERTWQLPIWDDFRNQMKSAVADLHNSGGRAAGTAAAGAFLENFIGDWPWAHIDIAYVDVEPSGRPYIPKGTTGIGLRLLVDVLSNWKRL